jgi:asparagine synthase (glutamine-hydrolysing)
MCGIAGFWQSKPVDEHPHELLNRMACTLAHRGPDDSGTYYDSTAGLGLAFRRLSIIDLSPDGHQPMASASGRYTIIFNGEVYNFEDIRQELGPHPWRGHSDTEVMLAAFERWGLDSALKRFVGMFAFALWDRQEKRLHLVRDRLGIKPLYYGFVNGSFVFGSELKPLQQFPGFEARIDRDVLALYMRHSYVPSPYSIYKDIYKLKPGHVLTLSSAAGEPVVTPYWSATEIARQRLLARNQGSDADVIKELEEKLTDAVRLRMIADVPLGALLSGGIDSTTVVALMQAQSGRPVKTFSIGFHEVAYNEATYAKKIAAHLGTDHTELYVTPQQAIDVIPLLPSAYDEPFADSSQVPTYLVSKLARQHVTVSLSGDGGDELFCGYLRYTRLKTVWSMLDKLPGPVARSLSSFIRLMPPNRLDRFIGLLPYLGKALQPSPGRRLHKLADVLAMGGLDTMYLHLLTQWTDPSSLVLESHEPDVVAEAIRNVSWLPEPQEVAMLTDLTNYLPDDILTKVDRASMAVSLEARVPLLDHRVVEFAWGLPMRFKLRDGKQKWILRQILYRHVPPQMVERPKMGFGVPIDQWLRGPLRNWAEELLSPERLKSDGFFDVTAIRAKWEEHRSGARNWEYQLWTVLVFQDWLTASRRHQAPLHADNMRQFSTQ